VSQHYCGLKHAVHSAGGGDPMRRLTAHCSSLTAQILRGQAIWSNFLGRYEEFFRRLLFSDLRTTTLT